MSRIRSIKPEFWTSEQVMECSRDARLLFVGLWNFCDDAGRHVDSPKRIKAEVFPGDDFSSETIRGMVDELEKNGLIQRYVVDEIAYLQVTGWHHQRVDKPQPAKYPPIPEGYAARSENIPRTLAPDPIRSDPIGRDRKGEDSNIAASQRDAEDAANFETLRALYPRRSGDQRWHEARKAINARLAEGHTWQEILDGASRYAVWCNLTGKIGTETVKQAATFVGPGKPFLEQFAPPATKADIRLAGNLSAAEEFMRSTEAVQ